MMLDRYAGWDESLSGRRDRSRNGSGRCIKEDTDMDDDDGRYYSTGMLESMRCTDTDGSGDIPLMEDTEMDKKRFDRLLDYAEKRRDDPDASSTDVRYWAGYIDGLRALMKGSGGNESLSEIEALRRLR